jgi:hypothetical protein
MKFGKIVKIAALGLVAYVLIIAAMDRAGIRHGTPSATSTAGSTSAGYLAPGRTVAVARTSWCAGSAESLAEMSDWASRGDAKEAVRIGLRSHAILIEPPMEAKILDSDGLLEPVYRVRIVRGADSVDARLGRECWAQRKAMGN